MNVSGVSNANGPTGPDAGEFAARKRNFDSLQKAVESGDMSAAKVAYEAIQKDMKSAPAGMAGQGGPFAQMQSDFQSLGDALTSGDAGAVKDAFAAWQNDLQQMRPHNSDRSSSAEVSFQLLDPLKGTFKVTA